jgi:hypothetical protein
LPVLFGDQHGGTALSSDEDGLVLYDVPGADRREGEHTVFGDLLRRD